MLVVVVAVFGVTVPVVDVVDMVAVRNRDVAAAVAVMVFVSVVHGVFGGFALIDVVGVDAVQVPVVGVVDVVAVRHGDVTAAGAVLVGVIGVRVMLGFSHGTLLRIDASTPDLDAMPFGAGATTAARHRRA